jgi:tetratricopeptide (TPR) repeat protein
LLVLPLAAAVLLSTAAPAAAQSCQESLKTGLQQYREFHRDPSLLDKATQSFQAAAADASCAFEAHWRLADLYLNRGVIEKAKAKKKEHFAAGQKEAQAAIELKPAAPEGHYFYAVNIGSQIELEGVLKNVLKLKTLIAEVDKAIAADPNFAPALVVKARFMADLPGIIGGNDEKAEALFRRALKAWPNYENSSVEYARFLIDRHRARVARGLLDALFSPDFKHANEATWTLIDQPEIAKLREKLK